MKKVKLTVEVEGSEVTRMFSLSDLTGKDWNDPVQSMIATIEESSEARF